MFRGIEHLAIASPDPKRLADFYVTKLRFTFGFESGGACFVKAQNGAWLEIIPSEGDAPANERETPGLRHLAIAVDDFDAEYKWLKEQGVPFEGEPYVSSGNRIVFFRDPDGTLLHLIQREKPLP